MLGKEEGSEIIKIFYNNIIIVYNLLSFFINSDFLDTSIPI